MERSFCRNPFSSRFVALFPQASFLHENGLLLICFRQNVRRHVRRLGPRQTINVWRPNTIKHCLVTKHFTVWTPCLVLFDLVCTDVFDRVWSCLIKFEDHQTFKQQLKIFLLVSCLMGDLLFVWTAAYQTCLKRAYVPRSLSGLY